MVSKLFRLNGRDLIKGLVVSVVAALLTTVVQLLQVAAGFDWRAVLMAGAISGLSYLVKNLATDEEEKLVGVIQV